MTELTNPRRRPIGWRTLHFESIASTNTHALTLADDPSNHGTVVTADEQTAGRGQHGRTWLATPGSSVLVSALVFPPTGLRRPALLTAWAAVSVCDLIESICDVPPRIKWPNDVLISNRKVCGILIEQRTSGPDLATVVGIGLNVKQDAATFAGAGLPDAGSLAMYGARTVECSQLAPRLVQFLGASYDRLEGGDRALLEQRWQQRLGLHGKQVVVVGTRQTWRGCVQEIRFDGVRLRDGGGATCQVLPEEISAIQLME